MAHEEEPALDPNYGHGTIKAPEGCSFAAVINAINNPQKVEQTGVRGTVVRPAVGKNGIAVDIQQ